jgi:hypothetical protein
VINRFQGLGLEPIKCTDPLAAGSPQTTVAENFDIHLGTLDSRETPYKIGIFVKRRPGALEADFQCFYVIKISLESFPMNDQQINLSCGTWFYPVMLAPGRVCPKGQWLTPDEVCVNYWIKNSMCYPGSNLMCRVRENQYTI